MKLKQSRTASPALLTGNIYAQALHASIQERNMGKEASDDGGSHSRA